MTGGRAILHSDMNCFYFLDRKKKDKLDRIETAVEEIRQRYGKHSVVNASLPGDIKIPDDGRDLVRMPGLMYS